MTEQVDPRKLVCPICGQDNMYWLRCQYAGCTDGRYLINPKDYKNGSDS